MFRTPSRFIINEWHGEKDGATIHEQRVVGVCVDEIQHDYCDRTRAAGLGFRNVMEMQKNMG